MRATTEQVISISRLICTGCGAETNATLQLRHGLQAEIG
jgi:hypothetical protein